MTDKEQRLHLYQQYTEVFGPLASSGAYSVGDIVNYGEDRPGEIVWKCLDGKGRLIYVIDTGGWPIEVSASRIKGRA